MLYQYKYISAHIIHRLNENLNYFFRKIQRTDDDSVFDVKTYFHVSFADDVDKSPVLRTKFASFFETFKHLSAEHKASFYNKVLKCRSVQRFFEDETVDCSDITHTSIKTLLGDDSLYELMKHLFKTTLKLSQWGLNEHYKAMYDSMPDHKVCPFCGIGEMHQTFKEDYDHLLPKKKYPLLAINLQNLAPMCGPCNTKYKKEVDAIYKGAHRRPFAYPYTTTLTADFNFSKSVIPQTDLMNPSGKWKIEIAPDNGLNKTWFEIFKIEMRYRDDYVVPKFDIWIELFLDELISYDVKLNSVNDLKRELTSFAARISRFRFVHTNIIKAPLFSYLADCDNDIFYNSTLKTYNRKINTIGI